MLSSLQSNLKPTTQRSRRVRPAEPWLRAQPDNERKGAGMAVAMGAINKFFHIFTADHLFTGSRTRPDDSPRHAVTILDVLEPRSPRA